MWTSIKLSLCWWASLYDSDKNKKCFLTILLWIEWLRGKQLENVLIFTGNICSDFKSLNLETLYGKTEFTHKKPPHFVQRRKLKFALPRDNKQLKDKTKAISPKEVYNVCKKLFVSIPLILMTVSENNSLTNVCLALGANSLMFYDLFCVFISLLVGSLNTLIWMLGVAANETRLADAWVEAGFIFAGEIEMCAVIADWWLIKGADQIVVCTFSFHHTIHSQSIPYSLSQSGRFW